MPGISRKELKRDEFAAEMSKTYEFVQHQRARLIRIGAIVLAVLVVALGVYFYAQFRQRRAADELGHAMRVFYAGVGAEASADPGLNFKDGATKYAQAEKEFSAIAGKHSWFRQGRLARYYLGLTRRAQGKTEEAIRELREAAGGRDERVSGLARFALAETYVQSGRLAEAEKLYRELAAKPNVSVPREMALLALADHMAASKPAESEKIYRELAAAKTNTAAADAANRRLSELKKK